MKPPVVLLLFLLSALLYFFSYPEADPDLWGHLFFGREILQSGTIPPKNVYSYTAPDHIWVNHEWLAEAILYALFRFLGPSGLILFKTAVGAGIVWILDRCIRKKEPSLLVRALVLVWVMAILSPGFNIRPQLFTYFLFAVLLSLLRSYEQGKRLALGWIPLVTFFWVNLHGGVVAGIGALTLFISFAAWTAATAKESKMTSLIYPAVIFFFSISALLLNPYSSRLLVFLAKDLLRDRPVGEWAPIPLMSFSFLDFKLALLVALPGAVRKKSSWRRWDFWLVILAALLALRHQRHTPLFGIVAAPYLAAGLGPICRWIEQRARVPLLAFGLLAVAFYQLQWIGSIHLEHRLQLVVHPLEYPTQAANFLKVNGVRGNLAAPFDWGEYLIWKLYPDIRVSIDGRYTTAYPVEVIRDEWEWMEGGKEWERLLNSYPTDLAITKRSHPVTGMLRKDPDWVYIYSDPLAFVFVRKTTSQQGLLEKFTEKRLLPPQSPPIHFPG